MSLLNQFEKFQNSSPAGTAAKAFRQKAFEALSASAFPTKKDEEWKYINIKPILECQVEAVVQTDQAATHDELLWASKFRSENAINIIFVNGVLNRTLSDLTELAVEMDVKPFESEEKISDQAFVKLNQVFSESGLNLELAANKSVEKSVVLWNLVVGSVGKMTSPRLKLKVGAGSKMSLLEGFASKVSGSKASESKLTAAGADKAVAHFQNSVTEVTLADSANLTHAKLQCEDLNSFHVSNTKVNQLSNSNLIELNISVGARIARHNFELNLNQAGANSEILGANLTTGTQHCDHNTLISHHVGRCNTNQLYKSILADESRSVFSGKIYIAKDAQQANSSQLNNNLLLSSSAEADSKPQLEIYADDVKAAHGSTVGQLDPEEVFYLQSRGISKEKALPILSHAFLGEVLLKVEDLNLRAILIEQMDLAFARLKIEDADLGTNSNSKSKVKGEAN